MPPRNECPYGAEDCPKLKELRSRITRLEQNQTRMMRIMYYVAGIVSVTLGVQVMI